MYSPFRLLLRGSPFAAILMLATRAALAGIISYDVNLSGPAESPANNSPGIGSGTVIVDTDLHTLAFDVTFSGLQGTTTMAHIHASTLNPFAGTAGVATTLPSFVGFPLGVTSGTFNSVLDLTQSSSYNPAFVTANGSIAGAETALLNAIASGRAYLNVHTSAFPGGEIRSFMTVTAVPEPSSILISGLAVATIATIYRKRRSRQKETT